ncbi:hypothetical protein KIN20_002835 [Parelaphostrongylus tenuis]|uniref:Uncharacterized protein n=1 Tax=Parelaphostrongylus tenuis TaxID=148309 RepID=A0AAD5M0E0_PARTN|nr:hypothetical protein KIN20_002835 [Parelaphostrongylus tenuis]
MVVGNLKPFTQESYHSKRYKLSYNCFADDKMKATAALRIIGLVMNFMDVK